MKSLKTLIISAAVCGAMALPLSSLAGHCAEGHGNGAGKGALDSAIKTVIKECKKNQNEERCKKLVKILNHHGGKD